jgi:hypothetical protein
MEIHAPLALGSRIGHSRTSLWVYKTGGRCLSGMLDVGV